MAEKKIIKTEQPLDTQSPEPELEEFIQLRVDKVKRLHKQTVENVVEMGRAFIEIWEKAGWNRMRDVALYDIGLNKHTLINYTNLAKLWDSQPDYRETISKMMMNGAYMLARRNIDPEVREMALALTEEGERLSEKDIQDANRMLGQFTKPQDDDQNGYTIADFDIDQEAQTLLFDHSIADNFKELKRLSNISKKSQRIVARILSNGEADTMREAIHLLQERNREQEQQFPQPPQNSALEPYRHPSSPIQSAEPAATEAENEGTDEPSVEVSYRKEAPGFSYNYLGTNWREIPDLLPAASQDLILAEVPMSHEFLENGGYRDLAYAADHALAEGGFLLATCGHKNVMYMAEELYPLEPLHVLTVRRQPGRTRSIVGINVACASVFFALAYKPPFRSPNSMLVDLQTIDTGDVGEMDEIVSGIESGVERFLRTLLEEGSNMTHVQCKTDQHFDIRGDIIEMAKALRVAQFYAVG